MIRSDEFYMHRALDQAHLAMAAGEVPVGAVVVDAGGHDVTLQIGPVVFGSALRDSLPALPTDPSLYPSQGGLFREGYANGYRVVRLYPYST